MNSPPDSSSSSSSSTTSTSSISVSTKRAEEEEEDEEESWESYYSAVTTINVAVMTKAGRSRRNSTTSTKTSNPNSTAPLLNVPGGGGRGGYQEHDDAPQTMIVRRRKRKRKKNLCVYYCVFNNYFRSLISRQSSYSRTLFTTTIHDYLCRSRGRGSISSTMMTTLIMTVVFLLCVLMIPQPATASSLITSSSSTTTSTTTTTTTTTTTSTSDIIPDKIVNSDHNKYNHNNNNYNNEHNNSNRKNRSEYGGGGGVRALHQLLLQQKQQQQQQQQKSPPPTALNSLMNNKTELLKLVEGGGGVRRSNGSSSSSINNAYYVRRNNTSRGIISGKTTPTSSTNDATTTRVQNRVGRNAFKTRQLLGYGTFSGGTTDTLKSKDSIHIAGFFPTSTLNNISSQAAIGRGVLPAVKLAIYHINNDNSTLPDYKLHISWNDTKCSASDGMKAFFDMMHELPIKYMLFGDACKQVTDPIAKASRYWKVAQLSYADMHPMYSKKNYPNLFRIVPSENEFNAPRLALLKTYNWTRVGTLYQNEPRYSLAHNKLVSDLELMGVHVVAAQSFADDISYHIHKLRDKDVRIILGNFDEAWARRIFCEAYREGLYGRKYQWLIVAAYTPTWWRKQDDVNCTVEEVETALKGALLMDLLPLSTSTNITISGLTADQYNEMYTVVKLSEYSRFHGYAYDGIWAIALALHNISAFYPDPVNRHKRNLLRTFQYHDEKWQTAFLKALEATSFTGVTGKVEFRDNGRKGTILIKQFRAFNTVNAEVRVGEFDGVSQTLTLFTAKDNQIVWNGKNPPKDRTIEIIEHTRVNPTLFAAMTVASSVGIVLACFFLAINIKFRNQRYIKMSSPYLNNLIIIGCIFTYTSVIILGLDSKLTSVEAFPYICTARAWILMAGFTLAFGSMFSKTWRVHSIFTNVKLNKKVIKDMQLFIVVGILLAIDFAIMTTWHFLDPMHRSTKKLEAYPNPNNDDVQIIPENEYCKSQYMNYFVGAIYAYKGLLMLFGCFLAWETRHVSIPALNDSKYIGMSVYNSVMMCVLGAPLSHVLTDKHDASFLIISVFIIFCTTATLCLVFLPKIIELKRNPKGTVEKRLRTTIKPPSQTRRPSATSMYEAELKTAKQANQKFRKQIREVDNEIQALAKILGDDAQEILHDAMHNLALPKSEVLKKEDTDVSSLYSLNSDGGEDVFIEDATEGASTPKKKYPGIASALAAAAGNLSSTAQWDSTTKSTSAAVVAKTILINSSHQPPPPGVKSSAPDDPTIIDDNHHPQHQLSNSPSEEPVTIEEKSLPKIPEETLLSDNLAAALHHHAQQQQQQQQVQAQRQQRSLSVVIMQPIQLLPKYLRLNKSDLDLSEDSSAAANAPTTTTTQSGGGGTQVSGGHLDVRPPPDSTGHKRSSSDNVLVVKDVVVESGGGGGGRSPADVSTTTQQEIWTMLQKERRYMDRNIYVGEEDEEDEEDLDPQDDNDGGGESVRAAAPSTSSSVNTKQTNKRLKSPTVAKPISLLLAGSSSAGGEGGAAAAALHAPVKPDKGMRLQLPKRKKKTDELGREIDDDDDEDQPDDEFINGHSRTTQQHSRTAEDVIYPPMAAHRSQKPHHRRLSMQPYHQKQHGMSSGGGSQQHQSSSSPLNTTTIRTLSSSTTTLTVTPTSQQQHAYYYQQHQQQQHPGGSTHFPFYASSQQTHDPNTYSQTLTTTSSTRPISTAYAAQHASTEEINRSSLPHHPPISNNLSAKNRSYSVPRRLDNSQLNLSEINLDVSLLPIFHKILSERSRSLREGSSGSGGVVVRGGSSSAVGGSGSDLQRSGAAGSMGPPPPPSGNLRRNKRTNNLMLSCPNIMIKCDIVEYL